MIEPLRDDNNVTLSVDKDIRNIDDVINKMLNQQSEIEEHTLSDYVDVFISLGAQGNIQGNIFMDYLKMTYLQITLYLMLLKKTSRILLVFIKTK